MKVSWLSPSPLWTDFTPQGDRTAFLRPTILRFATDDFVKELLDSLAVQPPLLRNFVAQPENWRDPVVGIGSTPKTPERPPFKLFQPVQSRFYMVASTLACRLPGLPDHTVKTQLKESVSFVLRRLVNGAEYAWVQAKPAPGWKKVSAAGLMADEEKLPMFPVPFAGEKASRKLHAGLIPAGRQQQYVSGRDLTGDTSTDASGALAPGDYLAQEFERQVALPWLGLISAAADAQHSGIPSDFTASARMASVFIVLDFARYLNTHLQAVWAKIQNPGAALAGKQAALYQMLADKKFNSGDSLAKGLSDVFDKSADVDKIIDASQIPGTLAFVNLTDAALAGLIKEDTALGSSKLEVAMAAAVAETNPGPAPAVPIPAQSPSDPLASALYVVRLVYERPECGSALPVMSDPTEAFQIASYFDPDGPMRPVQVSLPVDPSPSALSKYPKSVSFNISNEMQKQLQRIKSVKDLLDGKVDGPGGFDIGFICSLSIPIITIVAFFLLMMFVIVLNIVFFWLPFFKICFPIPKFQAKA